MHGLTQNSSSAALCALDEVPTLVRPTQTSHEQLLNDGRIRSSPGALHDLSHEKAFQLVAAASKLLNLEAGG